MEVENQKVNFRVISGTYLGKTVYSWTYMENKKWKSSHKWFNELQDCLLDFIEFNK